MTERHGASERHVAARCVSPRTRRRARPRARAGRRRGSRHRQRVPRRARPRVRERLDGAVVRPAAPRSPALGAPRPRPRPPRRCRSARRRSWPRTVRPVTVEVQHGDLTRVEGRRTSPAASLVTASALLDVLTARRGRLASSGAASPPAARPSLTLSVTGRVRLSPADPLDATWWPRRSTTTSGARPAGERHARARRRRPSPSGRFRSHGYRRHRRDRARGGSTWRAAAPAEGVARSAGSGPPASSGPSSRPPCEPYLERRLAELAKRAAAGHRGSTSTCWRARPARRRTAECTAAYAGAAACVPACRGGARGGRRRARDRGGVARPLGRGVLAVLVVRAGRARSRGPAGGCDAGRSPWARRSQW